MSKDPPSTEIYTLSLHDALPIYPRRGVAPLQQYRDGGFRRGAAKRLHQLGVVGRLEGKPAQRVAQRSEEHTSELQSQSNLVCRLLLEKTNDFPEGLLLTSFLLNH